MGGHAFRSLYCPRFSLEIYLTTRTLATKVLNTLFTHVVEPAELPSKTNFGDLDFLVAGPKHAPSSPVDQPHLVELIKAALNTEYGRRSLPTDGVLFFAIPAPGREEEFHIQIDVHVVEVEGFEWNHFMYRYASGLKMVGSMVKPLGVTLDPKGCHVRVEEMERGDGPGSMVFVTREPNEVLEIVGLGRKFLEGGFGVNENLYEYLAGSPFFHPAHFAARLQDEKYVAYLADRSEAWKHFVTTWIPSRFQGYQTSPPFVHIDQWYQDSRAALRAGIFTKYPEVGIEYESQRTAFLRQTEEARLRELIQAAIPIGNDGFDRDLPLPPIIYTSPEPDVAAYTTPTVNFQLIPNNITPPPFRPTTPVQFSKVPELTPPSTPPPASPTLDTKDSFSISIPSLLTTPVLLPPFPHPPPTGQDYPIFKLPPQKMGLISRFDCLARWTSFCPITQTPYVVSSPLKTASRAEMKWLDSGLSDEVLVQWAREAWWPIWGRQCVVNWNGMWRKRMEKEKKKEKVKMMWKVVAEKVWAGLEREGDREGE